MNDAYYHTKEDRELHVTRVELGRPCRECSDTRGERRERGKSVEVVCATCGRIAQQSLPEPREVRSERDAEIARLRNLNVSVAEIARQLGIAPTTVSTASSRMGVGVRRTAKYSPEDLVNALAAWKDEHGRWPSIQVWMDTHQRPSATVFYRIFGSWAKALEAAEERESEGLL